jgi:hypothetical protein
VSAAAEIDATTDETTAETGETTAETVAERELRPAGEACVNELLVVAT